MAIDGFQYNEKRVEIVRSQGVPLPDVLVPAATAWLLVANLGIIVWKYPRAAAGALIIFFLTTTPSIHSFWKMEGKKRQETKINGELKTYVQNIDNVGEAVYVDDDEETVEMVKIRPRKSKHGGGEA